MRCPAVPILLGSLLLAMPAAADWPSQGRRVLVSTDSFNLTDGAWILDLPSGDLLVRAVGHGGLALGYDVQRVTPAGEIAPGWPAEGVSFGTIGMPTTPRSVGFAVDPQGFTWEAARAGGTNAIAAYAVSPTGALAGPWALTSSFFSFAPAAFAPAPNGVYAYFGNRIQRFAEAGTVAPGWPADGVVGLGSFGDLAALADGSGGVVVMATATTLGPRTLRVDSSGVKRGGRQLSDEVEDQFFSYASLPPLPAVLPSDPLHYFAVWSAPPDSAVQHVKVQRVGYDNTLAPGWPTAGNVVVAPATIFHVTPLSDRTGGLYIVWYQDDGLPRATHVRADGTFEPGTDAHGTVLFPPGPLREPQVGFDGGHLPYMVADVTPDGRLLFAWDDFASGNGIRVQWLLPDLTADPSEPLEGRLILPNPEKTNVRAVHAAPDGGAYVAWESAISTPSGTYGEIWMTRILPSALVNVAPRAKALALSTPRPNPTRGAVALDVTLPDDSPARVELLDVAGRVLRTQAVQGAGPHAIAFRDLATLAPGLYFARVRHPLGSAASRVLVSR